jgi:serine acetyltransferase
MSKVKRILKNLFRPCISCWRSLVVDGIYGGIWYYREHLREHPSKLGLVIYNSYLTSHSAWIGIEAVIDSPYPVCPHEIFGLFISKAAKIGKNCVIYQQVTIGSVTTKGSKHIGAPIIGNNVLIGAGAKIIGNVQIGDNVRIGANCIVTQNIPANSTVYMSGMTVLQRETPMDNSFSIECLD